MLCTPWPNGGHPMAALRAFPVDPASAQSTSHARRALGHGVELEREDDMTAIDTSAWTAVGETSNSTYFSVEPRILAAVPHAGARDDFASATSNQRFQNEYFRQSGTKGVVIVFIDPMVSEDAAARRVYGTDPDVTVLRASALVGGTLLSRPMISLFTGISRPRVPVKTFADGGSAIAWARELNAAAARA